MSGYIKRSIGNSIRLSNNIGYHGCVDYTGATMTSGTKAGGTSPVGQAKTGPPF